MRARFDRGELPFLLLADRLEHRAAFRVRVAEKDAERLIGHPRDPAPRDLSVSSAALRRGGFSRDPFPDSTPARAAEARGPAADEMRLNGAPPAQGQGFAHMGAAG